MPSQDSTFLSQLDLSALPQDPFLPQDQPLGPTFLDTEACLCHVQATPDSTKALQKGERLWRCFGNQTEGALLHRTGKWFRTTKRDTGTTAYQLPIRDPYYPAVTGEPFRFDNASQALVAGTDGLSVWDAACTGENQTTFSAAFYQAVDQQNRNELPIEAAPCWRPGAVPMQIQEVSDWQSKGCSEGFLCANNTVNSLPQFCPPVVDCQKARLGNHVCQLNGKNIGMGRWEPVICQAGWYCPRSANGRQTFICPKGTYCQPGAPSPTPCSIGSSCPEGSSFERFLIPIVIVLVLDLLLLIGMLLLKYRSNLKKNARSHRFDMVNKPKAPGVVKGFTAAITGYKQLPDDQQRETELEMSPMVDATYIPGRQDVWSGFAALDMPYDHGAMHADKVEPGYTPEIRAFVESMRKATDASDFGLSFGYNQLTFQPKGVNRPILQNVTGSIKRGSLTAIMGGSGAGKSTFVNVLMGKTVYTNGVVSINNTPGKLKRYKKLIGYVPQDDVVLPELTVYENILHSARIRLPCTWKDSDIKAHVNSVIDCLELSHVRDSLVGSVGKPVISGGQRKRASIGMELAAAPMAIFLDEPTSGLDATAASSIMRTLKALARLGISVIVIIHQPRLEIFDMLDDLILLANGQLIYEGPESEVREFFEHVGFQFSSHANFGDVVTDIITGNGRPYKRTGDISKESLIMNWRQRSAAATTPGGAHGHPDFNPADSRFSLGPGSLVVPQSSSREAKNNGTKMHKLLRKRGAPLWKQTELCLRRAMLQQHRAKSAFWFEMGLASLAGFLLGLAEHSKDGVLFVGLYNRPYDILSIASDFKSAPEMALLVAIAIGLVAAAPGVRVFSEEILLHRREAEAGHSRLAYFVAKSVSVVPRMALACLHFSTLLFILSVPVIPWTTAFVANLLYFYCITGLASCVSMVVRREEAPLLATMLSLIVGILSGAAPPLSNVKDWHMEWLWRASPGVWLAEIYFGQLVSPFAYIYDVAMAARYTGFHLDGLWFNMLILLAIGTLYRVIAYVGLFLGRRMRV
ncbi:hypothetical protein B0T17DRAFT_500903 [Bombardia bombarda]|uniref:ABC transporter domain-containing protein n=1 Tax=Bombardia bombarda TaxID=252184 RepID=A0AA39U221_9PEZI|nr:hypothetical protein B0T17DRAFT_500903 [Bombardia bombarda]